MSTLINKLRQTIKDLDPLPAKAPEFTWLNHRIELRRRILEDDPSQFLMWSIIQATMVTDPEFQNYHLDLWEQKTEQQIADLNSIVEFGSGYGAMIKICHQRGFAGKYYSYDFPEFVALQRYYLPDINILTDLPDKCDLLIAVCSLSETDLMTKEIFFDSLIFNHCLVRYQHMWGDIDNHLYFSAFEGQKQRDEINKNHWYWIR